MYQSAYNPQAQMMNWYPNQQQSFQTYQQPVIQRPTLPGKVVNSTNDITPSDVPMDGSTSLFPTVDGSFIFAKSWSPDGTIKTVKYGVVNDFPDDTVPDANTQILARLDAIEKLLNRRNDNYQKRKDGDSNGNN